MRRTTIILVLLLLSLMTEAQGMQTYAERALWASINGAKNASLDDY